MVNNSFVQSIKSKHYSFKSLWEDDTLHPSLFLVHYGGINEYFQRVGTSGVVSASGQCGKCVSRPLDIWVYMVTARQFLSRLSLHASLQKFMSSVAVQLNMQRYSKKEKKENSTEKLKKKKH